MRNELEKQIEELVGSLFGLAIAIELTRPASQFGDFSTNIAMQVAGKLGEAPRNIADQLAENIRRLSGVKAVDVAGPGFINITVTDGVLLQSLDEDAANLYEGKTILVEYSDPNPFKPLHAGHLYTTLVGDSIARLLQNAGANVIRLNFGGDVGLHVAKSMWSILKSLGGANAHKLEEIPEVSRPTWLGERYVEGNDAYDTDELAKSEITKVNKQVYEVHARNDKDSEFARIYWTCRQWSYDYFGLLYKQLEVDAFDRFIPESEVAELGLETVRKNIETGVYTKSEGAVIFEGEKYGLHNRVFINSEGLPTYEAKDVGLSMTKWRDYHFDTSIIITANEQTQYMQVVQKSIEQFEPEAALKTKHLTHGVVKLVGGVKMSSRKGNIVSAIDILEAARKAGKASGVTSEEHTVLAAVKYAFAKNRIGGDILYDPQESVALEGNSGPYLQYAHARASSILKKRNNASVYENYTISNLELDERLLVRKLSEYSEIIVKATKEFMPHHICAYLYELAQEFNRFYEKNRVIGSDREEVRVVILIKYRETLKKGLELLGIYAPDHM